MIVRLAGSKTPDPPLPSLPVCQSDGMSFSAPPKNQVFSHNHFLLECPFGTHLLFEGEQNVNKAQASPRITLAELAEHLGGSDTRIALNLACASDMPTPGRTAPRQAYRFAWDDIFRLLHGIEPNRHLDILEELNEPLWRTEQVAAYLSLSVDALRKARSRHRLVPPPSIRVSDRIELWRPRDIRSWERGEAATNYVKPKHASASSQPHAPYQASVALLFGAFPKPPRDPHRPDDAHSSRTASTSSGKYT
jgi:hypothetical protein